MSQEPSAHRPRLTHPTRIITLANLVSIFRAFLALPIFFSLSRGYLRLTLILIALAVVSDFLDGALARRAHEVTDLGKFMDPIADKVVIFAIVAYLVTHPEYNFPEWFLWYYALRDLSISGLALYVMNHSKITLSSNAIGKLSVGVSSAGIVLFVIEMPEWGNRVLLAAALLLAVSWIQYLSFLIRTLRDRQAPSRHA